MKTNIKTLAMATLTAMTIAACSKSSDAPAPAAPVQQDQVLSYIRNLGFPAASIQDNGAEYIVEGDIIFPKNMEVPADNGKASTEQYYTGSKVSASKVANIRLKVDASMSSMSSEITSAINQWNNISGSRVKWSVVTGSSYDVIIKNENLGSGTCGQGTFPSGGNAGGTIRINKSYIAGNSFAQRARTICHEMGHNISIRHTNWSARGEGSATAVPGVGGTDASSLMNGGQCNSGATTLSTKDKQAAVALYPN